MENQAVRPINTAVLSKWNWGAFMFPIIWGIGNRSYLTFLTLIPIFGLIWRFVCGAKGNRWAFQSSGMSPKSTMRLQESWNRAGKVAFFFTLIVGILWFLFFVLVGGAFISSLSQI